MNRTLITLSLLTLAVVIRIELVKHALDKRLDAIGRKARRKPRALRRRWHVVAVARAGETEAHHE